LRRASRRQFPKNARALQGSNQGDRELKAKRVALGDAVKQMLAGRNLLFTDGDQMAAMCRNSWTRG